MPELPSGELTFCFTDIEGSSALSTRLGEAQFAATIERHREILREAWRPLGGIEVNTEGDGCFVVFADVDAALAACLRAQQRLADEAWPADVEVRVRMGVHTGQAVPTVAGDYISLAVNQAARVAACGHGGQVVVSAAAESATALALRRLGRFRLRDFPAPLELFQLLGEGLESEFPPLRGVHSLDLISVAIADDQALVRGGFAVLLGAADDIDVVGEAADGRAAVDLAVRERPDVVLMDIRMPEMDGVEATRRITGDERLSSTRVVILTTFDLDEYVFDAVRAGASGFLLKDTLPGDLLNAVRVVARGEALVAPRVTRRLIEEFLRRPVAPGTSSRPELAQLTPRETEVLAAVARGLSNTEIATTLFMSHATAKTHVSRLLTKLHARDRAQLVMLAYEAGVVAPGAS